uniref:Type II/IV secretion system protein n=1 Tax=Schlesneria paludicola TaxID=360056 RepID=A0A7C2JZU7_9PLAN
MAHPLLEPKRRLGELLVRLGHLTPEQTAEALRLQAESHGAKLLGEVLLEQNFCTEEQLLEGLAAEFHLPFVRLDARLFDPKIVDVLPREFIDKHAVLPLFRVRDTLTVALAEPSNVFLLDQLRELSKCQVQICLATAKDIRRTIQTYLPNAQVFVIDDIIEDVRYDAVELIEESIDDIGLGAELAGQSPIIRLVNYIIYTAVKEGASDIHIEPTGRQVRVRYRVDGILHKSLELPPHIAPAVSSRIKIMATLDISERRLPQDGRIQVMMERRPIDLRVSTLPLAHGEKVVLRILDNQCLHLSLSQLGFGAENLTRFQAQIARPNGIVLVTGPTGSGKSTTLYAAMNSVATVEKNVCTVEDPVEYQLPLVNQFQVNERIGLSFATVLRSLLRQDPDILMVGEIRDEETARIAIQAALTGHLVFSTLHTNDACSAVTRLIDMGVEEYLLAAALNGVLAQRLCRRICAKCRQPYEPPKSLLAAVARLGCEVTEFYRGAGCKRCRNTGFSGRIAIHEVLAIDDGLRELIAARPSLTALREYARSQGMSPLRHDGLRKVAEGLTTIEEVFQVSEDVALLSTLE